MFRRWSFWMFLIIFSAGVFGPLLFKNSSDTPVAPVFSKPLWLDRSQSPTVEMALSKKKLDDSLNWKYEPPGGFILKGHISFTEPPEKAALIWRTPEKSYVMKDLAGITDADIDIDARDVSFKMNLGLDPFEDPLKILFPGTGNYRLIIESNEQPSETDISLKLPGSRWGLLGTDQRGRDVMHLFLLGIRVSLLIGISATLIASIMGLGLGMLSGYAGGLTDSVIMRLVDILMSIPTLPILMVFATIWGKGLLQLIIILSVFSWMGTARTVRSLVLVLRDAQFVEGLRALGASTGYILRRHMLPEAMPLLMANIALGVPGTILSEAGLSFLGLSDPRITSWGRMLHEAYGFGAFSAKAWWLLLPPGIGITLICLIFMDLGKYLEERIDPDLRS